MHKMMKKTADKKIPYYSENHKTQQSKDNSTNQFKRMTRFNNQPQTTATANSLENKNRIPNNKSSNSVENRPTKKNNLNSVNRMEKYKLLNEIGKGSYASVRLAEMKTGNEYTKVAIKMYDKMKLLDPQRKQNVQREINILKMADHKNIIKLIEVISTQSSINLVLEYISEVSMFSYLKQQQKKRLDVHVVTHIIKCVSSAIQYLHQRDIVHRDIKLENIIIDDTVYLSTHDASHIKVKLIDFGFALQLKNSLQRLRVFCGTPCYMAPEMLSKMDFRPQTVDVWALGVLLYVLMVGRFPFRNNNQSTGQHMTQHQQEQKLFQQIKEGRVEYPDNMDVQCVHLLKHILQVAPSQRFQTAQIISHPWIQFTN